MKLAGILAAFAVSLTMWIIGLSWSPRLWLVIMGFGLLALVQLWRLAARASEPGPSDDEVAKMVDDALAPVDRRSLSRSEVADWIRSIARK